MPTAKFNGLFSRFKPLVFNTKLLAGKSQQIVSTTTRFLPFIVWKPFSYRYFNSLTSSNKKTLPSRGLSLLQYNPIKNIRFVKGVTNIPKNRPKTARETFT